MRIANLHRWLKSFVKQKKLLTSVIRHVAYSQENNGDCLLFGVAPFCFPFYDTHLHAIATCCKAEASLKKKTRKRHIVCQLLGCLNGKLVRPQKNDLRV